MINAECGVQRAVIFHGARGAAQAIQKYGAIIKSPSGYPVQSPYVAIANRQAEIMMRIASEFGFTPASRSRIATPSQSDPTLFDLLNEIPVETTNDRSSK